MNLKKFVSGIEKWQTDHKQLLLANQFKADIPFEACCFNDGGIVLWNTEITIFTIIDGNLFIRIVQILIVIFHLQVILYTITFFGSFSLSMTIVSSGKTSIKNDY